MKNIVHYVSYEATPDRVKQGKSLCYVLLRSIKASAAIKDYTTSSEVVFSYGMI